MSASVCAIVTTYNRRDLLAECLAALEAQTRRPDATVVVDNASTDGTAAMLREQHPGVELLALAGNEGSAGGFHEGLAHGHRRGFDWFWLMDDDTLPAPGALAELLGALERLGGLPHPYLLASKAVWRDGTLHPMNAPGAERRDVDRLVASAERRLLPLRSATFVSLLVARRAVERYGLPEKRYFVWSDDGEYTARILRRDAGYLVPTSVVHHKTQTPHTAVTAAGGRFYFHVRNTLFMLRSRSWEAGEKLGLVHALATTTWDYLRRGRFAPSALAVVARGVRDGLLR